MLDNIQLDCHWYKINPFRLIQDIFLPCLGQMANLLITVLCISLQNWNIVHKFNSIIVLCDLWTFFSPFYIQYTAYLLSIQHYSYTSNNGSRPLCVQLSCQRGHSFSAMLKITVDFHEQGSQCHFYKKLSAECSPQGQPFCLETWSSVCFYF